jgi:hypothetical protein
MKLGVDQYGGNLAGRRDFASLNTEREHAVAARQKSSARLPAAVKPPADPTETEPDHVIRTNGVLSRPVLLCLLILTVFAVITALYIGKDVILPIVFAAVLKLLLQPIVDFLCTRLRVPYAVSAALLILGLFGTIAVIGFAISGPASGWVHKAPDIPSLRQAEARRPSSANRLSPKDLQRNRGSGNAARSCVGSSHGKYPGEIGRRRRPGEQRIGVVGALLLDHGHPVFSVGHRRPPVTRLA